MTFKSLYYNIVIIVYLSMCESLGPGSVINVTHFLGQYSEFQGHRNIIIIASDDDFYQGLTAVTLLKRLSTHLIFSQWYEVNKGCSLHTILSGITNLYILLYKGTSKQNKFLIECAVKNHFSYHKYWLFPTTHSHELQLTELLQKLGIRFDSNVNIAVIDRGGNVKVVGVYTAGQKNPLTALHIGNWSSERGFISEKTDLIKILRQRNLSGYEIRAAVVSVNNFYIQVGHENGKTRVTGGFFGDLFQTLIELINSTYSLSVLPGYSYGHRQPNSSDWSGLIGVLQRRQADMSACEITIGADRTGVLSFAQPVRNAGCRFYFQTQFQEVMFKPYLQPFDGRVWLTLLGYVIATALLKWFFHYVLRERADPITAIFAVTAALLNQGSGDPRRCACRVLYFSVCALFLILRIGYGARLTATSTLRQPAPPYRNMEDILASDWSLNIISNSFALESMQMSPPDSPAWKLWQTKIDNNPYSTVENTEDGLQNVLDKKKLAFFGFEDSCRDVLYRRFSAEQSCRISELDGVFFKAPLSFALPRDSEFLLTINYWILRLFETGIIDRLSRKWLPKPPVCDDNKYEYEAETFADVLPMVILFASGLCLAVTVLIGEVCIYSIKHRKVKVVSRNRKIRKAQKNRLHPVI